MRLFIALPVGNRESFIFRKLQQAMPSMKCAKPAEFHLTIQFLGHADAKLLVKVKKALSAAAASFAPLEITIDKIGTFPPKGKPRIVWAGFRQDEHIKALRLLQKDISARMKKLGFKPEYKFSPHITLARVKYIENVDAFAAELKKIEVPKITLTIKEFCLFESKLSEKGAEYNTIAAYGGSGTNK